MNSFTEKRVTWKSVMMSSWTGLTLPRTAPKATHTEPTQKSALMRLWGTGQGRGLWAAVSQGNFDAPGWRAQAQPLESRHPRCLCSLSLGGWKTHLQQVVDTIRTCTLEPR